MRNWIDLLEQLDHEEYEGQDEFIAKLRDPRITQRYVRAIVRWRDDVIAKQPSREYLDYNIISNWPHRDASQDAIEARLGLVDWEGIENDRETAMEWALKILNDAIAHPLDWDCICGAAMSYLLGKHPID